MSDSNEQQKSIQWMSVEEIESKLEAKDSSGFVEAIRDLNEEIADEIVRNRQLEAADFADAQHQIVGYEMQ